MILATTKVEDFDRFLKIFSTKGAEKRKQHGSKGSTVFRDPSEEDRVWVIFDWDEEGWAKLCLRPRRPCDLERSRAQRCTPGGEAGRPLRRLAIPCWANRQSPNVNRAEVDNPPKKALTVRAFFGGRWSYAR